MLSKNIFEIDNKMFEIILIVLIRLDFDKWTPDSVPWPVPEPVFGTTKTQLPVVPV